MFPRYRKSKNPFFLVPSHVIKRYDHIAIHCSATPPSMDIRSPWLDNLHRNVNKWRNGNGYHVVVPRDGKVETDKLGHPCRPLHMAGAHVGDCGPGWNTRTLGVCYIGGIDETHVPQDNRTEEQKEALAQTIRWFFEAHPTPWEITVLGHRDLIAKTGASPKACPSFDVNTWMIEEVKIDSLDWQEDLEDLGRPKKLEIPKKHTVRRGETYWSIAKLYGLNLMRLQDLNPIRPEKLRVGDEIKLQ